MRVEPGGVVPKFSIVIPLYNKASHIGRSINSVLSQKISAFELLVVNDGSTDGGERIVQSYIDPRIRLINQANAGVSAARNLGIHLSVSPYVAFLDADDSWDPDFLTIIDQLTEEFPGAGAFAVHIRGSERIRSGWLEEDATRAGKSGMIENYFERLNAGNFQVTSSSICIKREVLKSINGFDQSLEIGEDLDTWLRVYIEFGIALSSRYAATYHTDAENRHRQGADFSARELEFFTHLRRKYLNSRLDRRSYAALDEWTSRQILQIVIRSAYQGEKGTAAKVLRAHWRDLRAKQRAIGLARICAPNTLVELIKDIARRRGVKILFASSNMQGG